MRIAKILNSFYTYNDKTLLIKAKSILSSMVNNPFFPDPIPTLAELEIVINNYGKYLIAAADFGTKNVSIKNVTRQQLERLLSRLGWYVMYMADGDEVILTSSGFSVAKVPEAAYITNPGSVTLSNGISSGQLTAAVKTVKGANGYLHEISSEPPADDIVWLSIPSTRSQFTFKALQPGKKYWVRIAATGTGEQIAYSSIVSQYAQ